MLHNQAMHRMPKPPLRSGFVTGDGGRYVGMARGASSESTMKGADKSYLE
jgi:hypothetical protein